MHQVPQELQNIERGYRIERTRRLVGNHQRRAAHNGLRNRDTLALPSAQLVRIRVVEGLSEPHPLERASRPLFSVGRRARPPHRPESRPVRRPVRPQNLRHLIDNTDYRIQTERRLLLDQRNLSAADLLQPALGCADQLDALEASRSANYGSAR